ncbi:hypothetical protein ASPZODRAFT_128896 [Penicilliopsis zonata CBS 506.65]|uniref:3-phytase n=1 Tax=Penicilliopsis zonata CBS 506.65 TaxID=1073090 RepID=A0A1L9SST2_9EURO|nr:hypothetical protein ASPZODRAFT_128896 [Penicilliopsis zonata CBS 506.65]OJJ50272.1 hypothetical protein ASPZODRAFT_128896 [Penicilliopsis zonata CBS 506.65]
MVRVSSLAGSLGLATTAAASLTYNIGLKEFSQEFRDGFSILKHYGGDGPYSQRESFGISRDPPASCQVDQVIMIKRHGERYPSAGTGADIEEVLEKLYASGITEWKDDLTFFNDWSYYVPNTCYYEAETFTGPYAGLADGLSHGMDYGQRYGHLLTGYNGSVVPIFSSGYERVINTARKFGEGFFGYNYTSGAALNIISEDASQGADSLTPSCDYDDDTSVCDSLTYYMPQFDVAAARFNEQNPGLNVTWDDIFVLMTMAAFELNARPSSPWINAFTADEWVAFGYANDVYYYYCAGPGDKNMLAVGAVYLNASLTLMNQGPKEAGSIYLNFAHDTNITPIIAALGIVTPTEDLPLDTIAFGNPWAIGNIMPMGGHLTIERLSCNATAVTDEGSYVRLVINEAVVPYHSCQSGPGYSCPLANFTELVSASLPDYISSCNVSSSYPQYLDFWWNYNTTTDLNYMTGPLGCQVGATMV